MLLQCGSEGWERLQGSGDLAGDVLNRVCEQVMVRLLWAVPWKEHAVSVMKEWVEEEPGSFLLNELKSFISQGGM